MPTRRRSAPTRLRSLIGRWLVALGCGFACAAALPTNDGPWGGSYFPNVPLQTQDGATVRFFDDLVKDKVVAINFIFTSCGAVCPLETAKLREVQKLLGDRVGRDVFMYSISIDPDTDTPEVLKAYAARFKVGPGWTFLTGKEEDITLLRQKLGLYMKDVDDTGSGDHNLSLIIGNQKTGRWQKASTFENPYILANLLGSSLHNWKRVNPQRNDYAKAPIALPTMTRGEELFRTRCSSCHSIGAPAGSLAAQRSIGPDLAGVTTQRDPLWLRRWLKEPDRMLAERDPIATALFERYNRIAMPNLQLNTVEIEALLDYLAEGSDPERGKKLARE